MPLLIEKWHFPHDTMKSTISIINAIIRKKIIMIESSMKGIMQRQQMQSKEAIDKEVNILIREKIIF